MLPSCASTDPAVWKHGIHRPDCLRASTSEIRGRPACRPLTLPSPTKGEGKTTPLHEVNVHHAFKGGGIQARASPAAVNFRFNKTENAPINRA